MRRSRGFTLIELVVSIVISGVILTFMALFVTGPIESYFSQSRRAALVDASDAGWRQLDEDIRSALPNSVRRSRNGSIEALELLATIDVARYRDAVAGDARDLDFGIPDGAFTTAGRFRNFGAGYDSTTAYLAVNGTPAADPYAGGTVLTPAGTRIRFANSANPVGELDVTLVPNVTLNPPAGGSPTHRVFLVSGPVSYLCNEAAGTLTRYAGYGITAAQLNTPAGLLGAGAAATVIANDLTGCRFTVSPGTVTRTDVATLRFTFARAAEQMTLMREAAVDYLP